MKLEKQTVRDLVLVELRKGDKTLDDLSEAIHKVYPFPLKQKKNHDYLIKLNKLTRMILDELEQLEIHEVIESSAYFVKTSVVFGRDDTRKKIKCCITFYSLLPACKV